jgi:hypothetical protein
MSGATDFDFLHGKWRVRHRRLRDRGAGSTAWDEFEGTAETRPLLGGQCNIEEHSIPGEKGFSGIALRTFDPLLKLWSIYWISRRTGHLEPPVVGSFADGIGRFEGADRDGDRPIEVRFIWDRTDPGAPRWEQFFSYDDGRSWEWNWTMDFHRLPRVRSPRGLTMKKYQKAE